MKKVVLVAALGLAAAVGTAAAADIAAGEKAFAKCKVCHTIGEGAVNKVGPQLNGLDGRVLATAEGYKSYGNDLKKMGEAGDKWDAARLAKYLTDPRAFNPGTKMAFVGVKDPVELENVVAYVLQFGADGKVK